MLAYQSLTLPWKSPAKWTWVQLALAGEITSILVSITIMKHHHYHHWSSVDITIPVETHHFPSLIIIQSRSFSSQVVGFVFVNPMIKICKIISSMIMSYRDSGCKKISYWIKEANIKSLRYRMSLYVFFEIIGILYLNVSFSIEVNQYFAWIWAIEIYFHQPDWSLQSLTPWKNHEKTTILKLKGNSSEPNFH